MTSEIDIAQTPEVSVSSAEKKLVAMLELALLACAILVEWGTTHYNLPHPTWALWLQIGAAALGLIALTRVRGPRGLTIGAAIVCAIMAAGFTIFVLNQPPG